MNGMTTTTKIGAKPKSKEVWFAKFPFEENDGRFKIRPVIVLSEITGSEVEVAEVIEDEYLSVKVTSHPERKEDDGDTVIIKWKEANLTKPSVARVSKTMNIPLSQFIRKVGQTDDEDFINILQKFMELIEQ